MGTLERVGIHHMGSDRASCRTRIALGLNHPAKGVTLKVRVTWVAVDDSGLQAPLKQALAVPSNLQWARVVPR